MPLLEVEGIHTYYGQSQVLFGIDIDVNDGEIVALMGRNGVGKTTTLRSILGLAKPRRGRISFDGHDIGDLSTYKIARLGIGWVPEDRKVFPDLTVKENLEIGVRRQTSKDGWTIERVYELFPDLAEIRDRRGGFLSGGQQQMLTIGRSLMTNPRLLLLDEPSEGLAPLVVEGLRDQIAMLRDGGLSIILAEQNLDFVLSLSDRVFILEKGEVKFTGTATEARSNPELLSRYLIV